MQKRDHLQFTLICRKDCCHVNQIKVEKGLFSRYSTLAKAIGAAHDGDQILLRPGVYKESVVLTKSVEIYADGDGVIIECPDDNVFSVTAQQAVVRGLTIRQLGGNKGCACYHR